MAGPVITPWSVPTSDTPITTLVFFEKQGPDESVLFPGTHSPITQMVQGVVQLGQRLFLDQGLHGLSLIELEIKTYLLPDPSAPAAKIQDDLSGHSLLVSLYIS
jgi:hypothetical protein